VSAWLFKRSRRVRRVVGPYRDWRKQGKPRITSARFALASRRSVIGAKGWLPYRSYLSVDPKVERHYGPAIKQYHWRGRLVWIDRREIARQAEGAHARYVDLRERGERGEFDGLIVPPTDADLERAREWAFRRGLI
jgi:hypothetical protein